jgi:hypothetical protein
MSDDDVLGRWMAHHLGDLIVKAENTPDPERLELRREAADLILLRFAAVRATARNASMSVLPVSPGSCIGDAADLRCQCDVGGGAETAR